MSNYLNLILWEEVHQNNRKSKPIKMLLNKTTQDKPPKLRLKKISKQESWKIRISSSWLRHSGRLC
jgi:hypothetical protein